jgi:predicted ATPase
MFTRIQALRYRCLKHLDRSLQPFQVLVGPNASGKSTMLDVLDFLGDLVSEGSEVAVRKRTDNLVDLFWMRQGHHFDLAVEAELPTRIATQLGNGYTHARYEVGIGLTNNEIAIQHEKGYLIGPPISVHPQESSLPLFPRDVVSPETIFLKQSKGPHQYLVISKSPGPKGSDSFKPESGRKGFKPSFRLGPNKSTLGNLPADEENFPAFIWLRDLLGSGVQRLQLDSKAMRNPSPPGLGDEFLSDGSNLPWVIRSLREKQDNRFSDWLDHLKSGLSDLRSVESTIQEHDRHCCLSLEYTNGLLAPSWTISDGTLRFLALTIPAYLPDFRGVLLIEEPENGIHPRIVELVVQSLKSVYSGQVLVASHSPVLLAAVDPEDVLCFSKSNEGATDVVNGLAHPALRDWQGEETLGTLLAAGILS